MNILILGGSRFLGYHLVKEAVNRGHEVTIFNRGISETQDLPNHVEILKGDRNGDLTPLKDRSWDIVIDTSGYIPRLVKNSAELLSQNTDLYVFISSISVYNDFSVPKISEDAPVLTLEDPTIEEVNGDTYGPLKALCENEVEKAFANRALIIRPGLIVGPDDYTDRFTYWPRRISEGGEVLVPGDKPGSNVQFIDVRDLATFTLMMAEGKKNGVYNVTGPTSALTFEEFMMECKKATASNANFTWVSEEFLEEHQVGPWVELPLYLPSKMNMAGMLDVDITKAFEEGLSIRPLNETIQDTIEWDRQRLLKEDDRKAGLKKEKEQSLLNESKRSLA
ncbi:SDR family oxidoreductase [Litchfieldia alkalitelluris]|uniref:SDR family oxidoreductase n=1 Tax=Litchfieldia alkalitelluris TaxID=304268 RepID=UPI000997BF8A|nr:SDR family oxidoreductase [Litchfieldia alkalitelluris]